MRKSAPSTGSHRWTLICRFLIMGGECNYLLRCVWPSCRLEFVPEQVQTNWTLLPAEVLLAEFSSSQQAMLLSGLYVVSMTD